MDGGLLDIGAIQQMMQPTEEDRKRARQQAILMAGLNMMGRPKGAEWQTIGQAGLLGMGMYNNQLASIPQQRMEGLRTAADLQGLMLKQRAMQDAEGARQAEAEFYTRPPGAGTSQPAVAATTGGAMPKQSLSDRYSALAQYLASKGYVDQARKAEELALKFQRKLKDTKTLTQDGQRVTVNFYDDGTQELVPYGPDQEKAHFADNGAMTGIPQDPFTGKVLGAGIQKSLTPDAMLHDETARRGQNMTDARAREARSDGLAQQGKPQIVTGPNGELFTVDTRSGRGAPVIGPDGQPLSKGEKPLTESQAKATVFANQMITASRELDEIAKQGFTGTGRAQQLATFAAGTKGIPFTPAGPIAHMAAPQIAQKYVQAQRQWTEGFLRFQSGATITPAELEQGVATYFPQTGDGPQVIKQKEMMRRQAEQNMRAAAGAAGSAKFLDRTATDIRSQADAIISGGR
jgi:hypothetical protein